MNFNQTDLEDCFIIEPRVFEDKRGYFYESFNYRLFENYLGSSINFVQDNESFSQKGVLRGLHFQTGEFAQAKLVRVIKGEVLDVVVDCRVNSKTFGHHISVILNEDNKRQLFVPRGFAHGFVTLSEVAIFAYKCDNYYNRNSEGGIIFNDEELCIDWKLPKEELIISEKDLVLPTFKELQI
ncbi:MAG: dTDP-4-dehydrorhamnose 3,5-epimerase [Winogradskyella sp.]|uniref:dTDP-4-dehydrorhamnose 3,5-epimerase n=1 Tax=Winogradskyella sp. TaxID=1883156 RepID=UPI0025E3EF9C|nr:dTDP-4-dehydrorhamnose 3,5-epimerase [Winogradskyella sp.]NRB83877.1 dTDP-4-dehydrorhamnose 3,5-epimerase [Winogradskyella sp.]